MEPQNNPQNKENLVESLHNKDKLQSLRTYQGDVASFIQSKDQSLSDLALKNREEKEKRQERAPEQEKEAPTKNKPTSFFISIIGIVLLIASGTVVSYLVFSYFKNKPVDVASPDLSSIIKADRSAPFGNSSIATLKLDPKYKTRITAIETKDSAQSFIAKQKWQVPAALLRSLEPQYMLGLYGNGERAEFFLILKARDYGIAYRDMLSWEKDMPNDFKEFITASTTDYMFKDLVIKNKDTRSYSGRFGKTALIYTFLNQNTILITESETALTELVNAFATGNVTR